MTLKEQTTHYKISQLYTIVYSIYNRNNLSRFYEKGKAQLLTEAKVKHSSSRASDEDVDNNFSDALQQLPSKPSKHNTDVIKDAKQSGDQDCGICFLPITEKSFNLSCGHTFCIECWRSYLKHSIMSEGMMIVCMIYVCKYDICILYAFLFYCLFVVFG